MINVLILAHNLRSANGVASFVMNYYRRLNPSEIQMDFVLYADRPTPYYEEISQLGGKVFILPKVKNLKQHILKCEEILSQKKYDVIHDNTLHISIPMMWCARKKRVPVRILHSHNTKMGETFIKETRNKLFLPVLEGLSTDYAACSSMAGRAMFGKKHFKVIPNVINSEKFRFSEKTRRRKRIEMKADSKYIVGTVGRLSVQKNPFFAVDVFAELLKDVPNAEYWWIGSGELDDKVSEYIESKELSGKMKLLGNRTDTADLYQAMDCFFCPVSSKDFLLQELKPRLWGFRQLSPIL